LLLIESNDPIDFLGISPFRSTDLKKAHAFVKVYVEMARDLKEKGVLSLLESIC
jgi:mannitol 2-dehydrogenase